MVSSFHAVLKYVDMTSRLYIRFISLRLFVLISKLSNLKEAIFSSNLQRNDVSCCVLQDKSPPGSCSTSSLQNNPTAGHTTTCIHVCLQFYRCLQYLAISPQICVASCKKKLPRVKAPLVSQLQQ